MEEEMVTQVEKCAAKKVFDRVAKDCPDAELSLPLANSRRFYDRVDGKVVACEVFEITGDGATKGIYSLDKDKSHGSVRALLLNTEDMGQAFHYKPIMREGIQVSLAHVLPMTEEFVWNNEFLDSPIMQSVFPDPDILIE